MQERGIPFVVVFAPEASGIYDEFLPDAYKIERPTACEILAMELRNRGVNVVCPSEAMRAAKGAIDVCEKLDSHWSSFGAFICYRQIIAALGAPYDGVTTVWQDVIYGAELGFGDLGVHVTPERRGYVQNADIPARPVTAHRNTFDIREKNLRRFESASGVGKALIFRDSFANALSPFLERTFAETILVAPAPTMQDSAIDFFEPDCVILEVAERALFTFEDGFSDFPARTFRQEYLELAENAVGGRLQVQSVNAMISGRVDEALALAAMAVAKEGNSARIYNLAWALRHKELFDLCYKLTSEVSGDLNDPFVFYLQADSAYFLGRAQEAVDLIDKAIAIQPHNALYLFLRGEWLLQLGQYAEAAAAMEQSLHYAPLHERSWVRAVEANVAAGKPETADRLSRKKDAIFAPQ